MRSEFIWWCKRNKNRLVVSAYCVCVLLVVLVHMYIYQMGGLAEVTGFTFE